jgi:BirA family biotin operon repressor/biotin-[acetyl-CoA-carboxylase] ligase
LFDTVQAFVPTGDIALKWPNDVLLSGKKVSGILLESGEDWLVIGMGLNVASHPENALYPATSLREEGATSADLAAVLNMLLGRLGYWDETLKTTGFQALRETWLKYARKGAISVRLPQGTIDGEFAGLDADGGLCLRLADGSERVIATGDVFFVPRA